MSKLRLKLKTPEEVRKTLSRVINMSANGEMDTKAANTIINGCNAVLSSIRTDEQQRKIDQLEKLLEEAERKR